jgi:hypothetical protein
MQRIHHLAELSAWAEPIAPGSEWEHTYVTSTNGTRWGCFGSSDGGRLLRTATSNQLVADCLSREASQAGIAYGLTGVCQQAANRILLDAGLTVAEAGGYEVSTFFWGEYGRGTWPALIHCSGGGPGPNSPFVSNRNEGEGRRGTALAVYNEIVTRYGPPVLAAFMSLGKTLFKMDENISNEDAKLQALVQLKLGRPLDLLTLRMLSQIRAALQGEQLRLARELEANAIAPEQYLMRLNEAMQRSMSDSRQLLGSEDFHRVFGNAGSSTEKLIDRNVFLASRQPRSSEGGGTGSAL